MSQGYREPAFKTYGTTDATPLPSELDVDEVGATSAPLLSASFFIGARCKPYNEDFMLCKEEAGPNGGAKCLKEGRRVTRCAASVLNDLKAHCLQEFQAHWNCLEHNNHELNACRPAERALNKCAFFNLKLEKQVEGTQKSEVPVWMKKKPIYRPDFEDAAGVALDKKWADKQLPVAQVEQSAGSTAPATAS